MNCFSLIGTTWLVELSNLWDNLGTPQVQNINSIINAFFSIVLTVILIYVTYSLGKSQNKLQKDIDSTQKQISDNNIAFQGGIAKDNLKAMLYKHRVDCYLQLVQILYSVQNNNILKKATELTKIDAVVFEFEFREKLLDFVKMQKEANLLFPKNILDEINTIFKLYNSYVHEIIRIFRGVKEININICDYLSLEKEANSNYRKKCKFLYNPKEKQYSEPKPKELCAYTKNYDDLVEYYKSGKLDKMVSECLKVTNLDA